MIFCVMYLFSCMSTSGTFIIVSSHAHTESTVLATDPPLRHWAGLSCTHGEHRKPSGVTSSDLSRYPPHMMQGIAQAILLHTQPTSSPSPHEDRAHSLQSSVVGATGDSKDRPTTTPTSRIQALLDPMVLVRLGFKVRPLRDGGGKPSPGRQPPPLPSALVDLGRKIQELAAPWTTQVFASIHKQEKVHPFPGELLQQVRALICPASSSSCSPGQPF